MALADDVQRYLASAPVSAYPEPLVIRAWRWRKRHRRVLLRSLAAAAFLGLALFAALQIQQTAAAKRQAKELQRASAIRSDLVTFHDLLDQRHFYTAIT